jgi:hypothetical protein
VTSALLKLPSSMSKAQKLARVDQLLELLVRRGGGGWLTYSCCASMLQEMVLSLANITAYSRT